MFNSFYNSQMLLDPYIVEASFQLFKSTTINSGTLVDVNLLNKQKNTIRSWPW